jgi:hypothetical protein
MDRATAEVIAGGAAGRALKAGHAAPSFSGDASWTPPMPASFVMGQEPGGLAHAGDDGPIG